MLSQWKKYLPHDDRESHYLNWANFFVWDNRHTKNALWLFPRLKNKIQRITYSIAQKITLSFHSRSCAQFPIPMFVSIALATAKASWRNLSELRRCPSIALFDVFSCFEELSSSMYRQSDMARKAINARHRGSLRTIVRMVAHCHGRQT